MDILTLAQYKSLTGISIENTKEDSQNTVLITAANNFITDFCNITTETGQQVKLYRNHQGTIFLDSYPLTSIDTLELYRSSTDTETLVVDEDYEIDATTGKICLLNWNTSYPLRVTYTPATALETHEASQLQLAAQMLVDHWKKKEYFASRTTGSQSTTGDVSRTVPDHIRAILNLHKRYVV